MFCTATRATLVLINDFHPAGRPAQFDRSIPKVILAFGALPVFHDLQRSGLPNIDVSSALTMRALDLRGGYVLSLLAWPAPARDGAPSRPVMSGAPGEAVLTSPTHRQNRTLASLGLSLAETQTMRQRRT